MRADRLWQSHLPIVLVLILVLVDNFILDDFCNIGVFLYLRCCVFLFGALNTSCSTPENMKLRSMSTVQLCTIACLTLWGTFLKVLGLGERLWNQFPPKPKTGYMQTSHFASVYALLLIFIIFLLLEIFLADFDNIILTLVQALFLNTQFFTAHSFWSGFRQHGSVWMTKVGRGKLGIAYQQGMTKMGASTRQP